MLEILAIFSARSKVIKMATVIKDLGDIPTSSSAELGHSIALSDN